MSREIAKYIDHTLLKPDAIEEDVKKICNEAKNFHFYSVCVNGSYVETVARELKDTGVKVTAVVGFPLGACSTETKAFETRDAVKKGADEIDMVINIGALKSRNKDYVLKDIEAVVEAAGKATVKVIIETCLLTEEEKVMACEIAKAAGAGFVKTSTGFSTGGATVEDITLMRRVVGPEMGVKASGGIRDYQKAMAMIEAGASRIGASASVDIVCGKMGENQQQGY